MNIISIVQIIIILIVSIALHEYAHAYVSHKLWDPTPKSQNRLTPNPLKHLDPRGSLMMLMVVISWWGIWRGKPVQINPIYYKNPKKGEFLVAMAGPLTNLILATIGILLTIIYTKIMWASLNTIFESGDLFISFWTSFAFVNIGLAMFNLLPIPPLDGFNFIKIISSKVANYILQYRQIILIIFLVLILGPGRNTIWTFLSNATYSIFMFIFSIFGNIFY